MVHVKNAHLTRAERVARQQHELRPLCDPISNQVQPRSMASFLFSLLISLGIERMMLESLGFRLMKCRSGGLIAGTGAGFEYRVPEIVDCRYEQTDSSGHTGILVTYLQLIGT